MCNCPGWAWLSVQFNYSSMKFNITPVNTYKVSDSSDSTFWRNTTSLCEFAYVCFSEWVCESTKTTTKKVQKPWSQGFGCICRSMMWEVVYLHPSSRVERTMLHFLSSCTFISNTIASSLAFAFTVLQPHIYKIFQIKRLISVLVSCHE